METVIVAFEQEANSQRVKSMLEGEGVANCVTCRSGDQVRRILSRERVYCVVCGSRLSDGPVGWLTRDVPPSCSVLVVAPPRQLEELSDQEVYKLPAPVRREEVVLTVRLLILFGKRMERLDRRGRSRTEEDLVGRAKTVLMQRRGLSEEEAHRELQRRSMNAGVRMNQTARRVLAELEKA